MKQGPGFTRRQFNTAPVQHDANTDSANRSTRKPGGRSELSSHAVAARRSREGRRLTATRRPWRTEQVAARAGSG